MAHFHMKHDHSQRIVIISAVLITLVPFIPLFVLFIGLLNPVSTNPFVSQSISFIQLFQQAGTITLLINTLLLALLVSVLAGVIGLWFAWVEQRTNYPGAKWLGVLNLLPLAMPSYLLAITLREILAPSGFLSQSFNLPIFRGFFPAVIVLTLTTVPYVQLLISAALKRRSVVEEEAARSLGASKTKIFWQIIFPHLRPSFAFAWLITILYVISDFGAVSILDTQVLTWRLYQAVGNQQLNQATLFGVVIMVIAIPLVVIARYIHGHVPDVIQASNPRPTKRQALSWSLMLLTYLLHTVVIGVGAILPIILLSQWVVQAWLNGINFTGVTGPLFDTIKVSLPSALFIVIIAILPAWTVARNQSKRISQVVEQGTYIASSLPGILLAFGLMLAALLIARHTENGVRIYQFIIGSGILLFIGYMMRFMSEAYAAIKVAFLLFDPRLRDSARLLNVGKWPYSKKVAIPALLPGLTVSFTLVLLGLVKELPITLLLGGAMGLRTLSYRVYNYYQEAIIHDAALAGLIILVMTFCLLAVTLRWRRHA